MTDKKPFFKRKIPLIELSQKSSLFLLGPRACGKSTLLKSLFKNALYFDLLDSDIFGRFLRRPRQLEEEIPNKTPLVIIDEIQKLPQLLDSVHRMIENNKTRFILTGSSARKLKMSGVNLLAGRAWDLRMHPLSWSEIPDFSLKQYINRGGLPKIYSSEDFEEELKSYTQFYISEEIKAESIVRKLDSFTRFLDTMSLQNGMEIQFQSISSDSGVPVRTVESYLKILEDTLLCFFLLPFEKTTIRKAITRSKFYFFDVGIARSLAMLSDVREGSGPFGQLFEHFIIQELRSYVSYHRLNKTLKYWRSKSQHEVDVVIAPDLAIEIKSTQNVNSKDLRNLKALREEGLIKRYLLISRDPIQREIDNIELWPWEDFLKRLWVGDFL